LYNQRRIVDRIALALKPRGGVSVLIALLLLITLVLTLAGCGSGGGGTTSGGGGTTSAETSGKETVSAAIASTVVQFSPSNDSGVSGTATLTDTGDGAAVQLNMEGLTDPAGSTHLAHILRGSCADAQEGNEAPALYPLTDVVTEEGGKGSSMTVLAGVLVDQLVSAEVPTSIDVHGEQTGDEIAPIISCADLSRIGGSTTGSTAAG
jgi:hypothetical protein